LSCLSSVLACTLQHRGGLSSRYRELLWRRAWRFIARAERDCSEGNSDDACFNSGQVLYGYRELEYLESQARVCVEAVKSALEKMSWPSQAVEMFERWKELGGRVREPLESSSEETKLESTWLEALLRGRCLQRHRCGDRVRRLELEGLRQDHRHKARG
jgi:hypothetical protein